MRYVEEGVAGGVVLCGVDVGDSEEHCDEKDQPHSPVDEKAPDHGFRDGDTGVLDFFGHVGCCVDPAISSVLNAEGSRK